MCLSLGAQNVPLALPAAPPAPKDPPKPIPQLICPGGFPTDLTVLNCSYTSYDRKLQFITSSVTDQAMLLSLAGPLVTSAFPSTNSNPITIKYYGLNVGASYSASLARGGAEFFVGSIMHNDPRHINCVNDPRVFYPPKRGGDPAKYLCTPLKRFAHALIDSVTVRESRPGLIWLGDDAYKQLTADERLHYDAEYRREAPHLRRRWFAFDRLIGVYAGAYAQYPFEPGDSNTFARVSQRAALSFGTTVLGSFYTEYASSLFRHRSKAPESMGVMSGRSK